MTVLKCHNTLCTNNDNHICTAQAVNLSLSGNCTNFISKNGGNKNEQIDFNQ